MWWCAKEIGKICVLKHRRVQWGPCRPQDYCLLTLVLGRWAGVKTANWNFFLIDSAQFVLVWVRIHTLVVFGVQMNEQGNSNNDDLVTVHLKWSLYNYLNSICINWMYDKSLIYKKICDIYIHIQVDAPLLPLAPVPQFCIPCLPAGLTVAYVVGFVKPSLRFLVCLFSYSCFFSVFDIQLLSLISWNNQYQTVIPILPTRLQFPSRKYSSIPEPSNTLLYVGI